MSYTQGRVCFDADSHIMESPDWLSSYADPVLRERLGAFNTIAKAGSPVAKMIEEVIRQSRERSADPVATRRRTGG